MTTGEALHSCRIHGAPPQAVTVLETALLAARPVPAAPETALQGVRYLLQLYDSNAAVFADWVRDEGAAPAIEAARALCR